MTVMSNWRSHRRLRRGESQSHIVGDPDAVVVTQPWLQLGAHVAQIVRALVGGESLKEAVRKRFEPARDVPW